MLTARLRRLTEAGVFTMFRYSNAPRRYEYVLTERGRELHGSQLHPGAPPPPKARS